MAESIQTTLASRFDPIPIGGKELGMALFHAALDRQMAGEEPEEPVKQELVG